MKYGEPLSMGRNLLVQVRGRTEGVAGGVPLDAKSIHDWQKRNPKTRGEWWHPSFDWPVFGHDIWPVGSDQVAWRGCNLWLPWAGDDICYSGTARGGIPQLSGALESDKCTRRVDGTREAEGTDVRHGALRESQGSRVGIVQFPGTTAVQKRGGETRRSHWVLP